MNVEKKVVRERMSASSIWAVIPAAGIGTRMQADIPKQYMLLADRPVLEHTLERILSVPQVAGVAISLNENDDHWDAIKLETNKPVLRAAGGKERCDSVLNALLALQKYANFNEDKDWVLVHDAVRPCVLCEDIEKLITAVANNESGGLLAYSVRDTMKRQNTEQRVLETVDREGLWHALTPQLFPWRNLHRALVLAASQNSVVTDESSAMEQAGYTPLLQESNENNIKITRAGDLRMAELILRGQH
jgi:2-C-methyl-D-erythritol 4-phosphate cytidylyltransferase